MSPSAPATSQGLPDPTDPARQTETHAKIVRGIKDIQAGRTRPAGEVLDQLAKKHGLSRPS